MTVIYSRFLLGHKPRPSNLHLRLSRAATSFSLVVIAYISAAILVSKLFFKGSSLFAGPCKYMIVLSSCQAYTNRTRLWNWILEKSSIQHSCLNKVVGFLKKKQYLLAFTEPFSLAFVVEIICLLFESTSLRVKPGHILPRFQKCLGTFQDQWWNRWCSVLCWVSETV